jgi:hypothetical protein
MLDVIRLTPDDARDQHLAFGQGVCLEQRHSWAWRGLQPRTEWRAAVPSHDVVDVLLKTSPID